MAHLNRITLFPIKSLDGLRVKTAEVLPSGALRYDRAWAIVDVHGSFINGKRTPRVQTLRTQFDLEAGILKIWPHDRPDDSLTVDWQRDRPELEAWLSDYFGQPVHLIHNPDVGFPDDLASPGPTVISTQTLQAVADWFTDITLEEARRRFRSNLEVTDSTRSAFWEDHLFAGLDQTVPFQIGTVTWEGVNPCSRCIVPTRDAHATTPTSNFQKTFVRQRRATFPSTVNPERFSHFYRLAVNTILSSNNQGQYLHEGDLLVSGKNPLLAQT